MIHRLNESFICTWILIDEAQELAANGDAFAKTLADNWGYPLDLMFLDANGRFIEKLNAFDHLSTTHDSHLHKPNSSSKSGPNLDPFLQVLRNYVPEQAPPVKP